MSDKGRRTTTSAILDKGSSSNFIKPSFAVMDWLPSIERVKTISLRWAENFPFEVVQMVTMKLQIGQLRKEGWFLAALELATNVILKTAFIGKYIEVVSSKNGLTTLSISSPVATIDETLRDHIINISEENVPEESRDSTDERSCVVHRVATFPSMRGTTVQVKKFYLGRQLVKTHKNLIQKLVALIAQGIEDPAPGMLLLIKIASLSLSCTTLSKSIEDKICITSPRSWFRCRATDKPFTTNAV